MRPAPTSDTTTPETIPLRCRLAVYGLCLAFSSSQIAAAGTHSAERLSAWRSYLRKEASAFHLPGIAAAVIRPDAEPEMLIEGEGISASSAFVIGSCAQKR